MYILHFFLLSNIEGNPVRKFFTVYLVTLSLSIVMHVLIEKPVMKWCENRKTIRFREYYRDLLQ